MKFEKLFLTMLALAGMMFALPVFAEDDEEVEDGPDRRPIISIAEKEIENKTDVKNANFSALIDRITHELTACGVYRVMNEKDLGNAFKKEEVANVTSSEDKSVSANRAGFFIYLAIVKYGFTASSSVNALYGSANATQCADVELIMRVVGLEEGRKGETIKSCNISSGPVSVNMNTAAGVAASANLSEQALQQANQIVAKKIVNDLVRLTNFEVLDADNDGITVDIPGSCAKKGDQLSVFKLGKKIRSKRSGKVTQKKVQIATIVISEVDEESCTAQVVSANEKIEAGQVVRFADGIVVATPVPTPGANPPAVPVAPVAPVGTAVNPF